MEYEGKPQKNQKPEGIVAKLRQVNVLLSQGESVAEAVCDAAAQVRGHPERHGAGANPSVRRRADRPESGLDRLNWLSADPVDLRTGKEMMPTFKHEGRVQFPPPLRSRSIGMIRRCAQRGASA